MATQVNGNVQSLPAVRIIRDSPFLAPSGANAARKGAPISHAASRGHSPSPALRSLDPNAPWMKQPFSVKVKAGFEFEGGTGKTQKTLVDQTRTFTWSGLAKSIQNPHQCRFAAAVLAKLASQPEQVGETAQQVLKMVRREIVATPREGDSEMLRIMNTAVKREEASRARPHAAVPEPGAAKAQVPADARAAREAPELRPSPVKSPPGNVRAAEGPHSPAHALAANAGAAVPKPKAVAGNSGSVLANKSAKSPVAALRKAVGALEVKIQQLLKSAKHMRTVGKLASVGGVLTIGLGLLVGGGGTVATAFGVALGLGPVVGLAWLAIGAAAYGISKLAERSAKSAHTEQGNMIAQLKKDDPSKGVSLQNSFENMKRNAAAD